MSEVMVGASVPAFEAKAKRGRFTVEDEAAEAESVLRSLSPSDRWKGVKVQGGGAGIVVDRKGDPGAWLCDLWLAEKLAAEL
jgi:hypothetical protein